ncbi:MAG: hypothetical protein LBJ17_01560 [Dysgonamonadaceae bacterium]|jgi:hypothetical protein|nr:hypothetical protein [Dysgonamonadaceae bacterium]
MKRTVVGCLLFIFVFSCNNKNDFESFINKQFQSNYPNYYIDYDSVIIIPREGCTSCIKESERFIKENINNNAYLFIFTKISSEKELKITFGYEMLKLKNVIVDTKNIFYRYEDIENHYPLKLTKDKDYFLYERLNF